MTKSAVQPSRKAHIQTRIVDNPRWDPANPDLYRSEERVDGNTRESSIATMHARRKIDDKQKVAADRFRALYEATGKVGAQALDYSLEVVDGGPAPSDGLTQRKIDAVRELSTIKAFLGRNGYEVIDRVCGEGCTIAEIAAIMLKKQPSKRDTLYYGRFFNENLNLLCEFWGYTAKRA